MNPHHLDDRRLPEVSPRFRRVAVSSQCRSALVPLCLLFAVFCVCSLVCAAAGSAADDSAADDEALVPENGAAPPLRQKDELKPSKLDEELLKTIDSQEKSEAAAEKDRIEQAIEGMRSAHQRMTDEDTSLATQQIQERVIHDLEEALANLKLQQRNRQNNPRPNENQKQDQSKQRRQKLQKKQADPQNSSAKEKSDPDRPRPDGRRHDGTSRDSQERSDAARSMEEERARRLQMVKDVWGHLPPHVREAMKTAFNEKYLPKYEDLVKKYYEALAEKNRKQKGK